MVNATAIRDRDGRFVASRSIVTDMTERKRAAEAIRKLNESLEARVAQLTAQLERAEARIRELEGRHHPA
jgi:TolA-binding protein